MRPGLLAAVVLSVVGQEAAADQTAAFALIIGVNSSVDRELRPLRYADDDGVRYFDLFRALGHRTYLLTRPDANTRQLHAQAVAEAFAPRKAALEQVVRLLAADIDKARKRQVKTTLYFVYAGHGNIKNGTGYLGLEDHRLTAAEVRQLLERLRADWVHVIVDACYSYFLADARGPGGQRREVHGFSRLGQALTDRRIGLLLSTSATQESHEWEAFQAGVFSHEVRSGLYGAADADGDGRVSYREIAAFVHQANIAIPNERFRPRVYARPPGQAGVDHVLLDLRRAQSRHLEIGPAQSGRYLLETSTGVRLVDLHSSPRTRLRVLRPPSAGLLYLRRLADEQEFVLPPGPEVLRLADLSPQPSRVALRGAAHHAFSLIFSRPYGREVLAGFQLPPLPALATGASIEAVRPQRWRRIVGWGAVGLGAAALASGIALSVSAQRLRDDVGSAASHREVVEINNSIDRRNIGAVVAYSASGAAVAAGLLVLLWPDRPAAVSLSSTGTSVSLAGQF